MVYIHWGGAKIFLPFWYLSNSSLLVYTMTLNFSKHVLKKNSGFHKRLPCGIRFHCALDLESESQLCVAGIELNREMEYVGHLSSTLYTVQAIRLLTP